jgi:hypothetical protein
MRWTIRGISNDAADAVRNLAFETGSTLGDIVMLCIQHGLSEARRHLEAEAAEKREFNSPLWEINRIVDDIRKAFSLTIPERTERT